MAKKELPFKGKIVKGSHVWALISRGRDVWRVGEVIKLEQKTPYGYPVATVVVPGKSKTRRTFIDSWRHELVPRHAVAKIPPGTVYLVNTNIGAALSPRLDKDAHFEIYECGTRSMTAGHLLGYVILPCWGMHQAENWCEEPGWQMWNVGPNPYELLSFLGAKLPEIIGVYKTLANQNDQENTAANSNIETA